MNSTEYFAILQQLYQVLPEDFLAARKTAVQEHSEYKSALAKLKKPTTAAWAVNQLIRYESAQISQVLQLAGDLRTAAAQLAGAELRDLNKQRRQLTNALTTRARQLALELGTKVTPSVAEQISETLTAAILNPQVAQAVKTGVLVTAIKATGMDDFAVADIAGIVADPTVLGEAATAVTLPTLRVITTDTAANQAALAKERLAQANAAVQKFEESLAQVNQRIADIQAERLAVNQQLDEVLQQQILLEQKLETLDQQLDKTEQKQAGLQQKIAVAVVELAAANQANL